MSQMPALQHPDPPRFRALEALGLTAATRGRIPRSAKSDHAHGVAVTE
jgi:hypothetical protein